MPKDTLSFRPSEKCRRKLLELMEDNKSRTDVLEEAIDYYYAMKMNQMTDDPIMLMLKTVINDSLKQWLDDIKKMIVNERYDTQFILAYLDMCMKGFGFENDEETALELSKKTSSFKKELDKQIEFSVRKRMNNEF